MPELASAPPTAPGAAPPTAKRAARRVLILFALTGMLALLLLPFSPLTSIALLVVVELLFALLYVKIARSRRQRAPTS